MRAAFLQKEFEQTNLDKMNDEDRLAATQFIEAINRSPADSEMDISWQEQGEGYYAHLVEIDDRRKRDKQDALEYCQDLIHEIETRDPSSPLCNSMDMIEPQVLSVMAEIIDS
ncbi:MAG: hypothetical protein V7739_09090 [Motiliproteus sp.]